MDGFDPMSDSVALVVRRSAGFALTGFVGIWLSGCADASRFADSSSPFSNPFAVASNDAAAPTPRVSSQPLASSRYATAARPSPTAVASLSTPAPATTGSLHPRPDPVGGSAVGWTAVGGSPVVVGSSDDAGTLSSRYGVPQAALLSANGLRSPGDVHSGMRIVIPVYNVRSDARVAKADEETKTRHARKADDEDAKPRHARKADDEDAKPRHARKNDDEDARPRRTAKSEDEDAKPRAKAKAEDDTSKDGSKSRKLHKAEASAERPAKTVAQADRPVKETAKPEKPAPQVAKVETPKAARKPEVDRTPTADIAPTASADAGEAGQLRWPARGRIIQGFKQAGNDGINIALPEGTSVRAAEDGKVAYAGSALKGYGNLVLIRHTNGIVTAYANNGELDVKSGETVKRGQVIAKSGQTGDVSTPQLHFEVRKGQTPVDPTGYLAGL